MKTYLVTGAAGFIGSALAAQLVSQGNKVVTIDNLSTGYISNIPEGVTFIEGGCHDAEIINKLGSYSFEAIYHIAGQSSGEISFDDPVYDLQTNTQSTLLLLKYCIQSGCKKFIYASTMSVYGDQDILPVTEQSASNPKSLYGVGKLASEHYLRIYAGFGLTTTCIRLFNVYGPGQNLENMRQGMVSIFLAQALQQQHIHVKGSCERFRDFVYIDDVVEAFIKSSDLEDNGKYSCYNVCSSTKTTIRELLEIITGLFNEKVSISVEGSTLGDQFGIYGSALAIQQSLNWKAKVPLREGLYNMFIWAKNKR